MIKVTVEHNYHEYPEATDFEVKDGRDLYVRHGDKTIAIFAYSQWSHVEKVEEPTFDLEPGAINYLSKEETRPQHTCTCSACDPQVAIRALHRED